VVGSEPPTQVLADDVAHLRVALERLVGEGKYVVLVMHSYGGCVGSCAVEGLGAVQRRAEGRGDGGVVMLLYMTAFVVPLGQSLHDMLDSGFPPWVEIDGDYCRTGAGVEDFYSDVAPEQRAHWTRKHRHSALAVFSSPVTHEPWHHMPATYLVCETDTMLPVPMQERMAQALGPRTTVVRVAASHFPYLSVPDRVAEAAIGAALEGMRAIQGDSAVAAPAQQEDTPLAAVKL